MSTVFLLGLSTAQAKVVMIVVRKFWLADIVAYLLLPVIDTKSMLSVLKVLTSLCFRK